MIPYGRQNINQDDIDSVVKVLKSDFLTQGPITPKFEKEVENYCNVNHAIAVINATSGLHLACLALGVSQNDLVWTSPISFVASANCAKYCGAEIDFVDIDIDSFNISVEALEAKLKKAKINGKVPKVLIVVHLAGSPCEMKDIWDLSQKYGFKIIEDASHAFGAKFENEPIGSCKYSDITVFSFHPVKIITTCEGGVCTTNDKRLFEKIYLLRSHGIVRNQIDMKNLSHGSWYYEQLELGFNYRLNDLQAALGINQLKRVDKFVEERNRIAKEYDSFFEKIKNIKTQKIHNNVYSSYHLYIILIKKGFRDSHKILFEKLRAEGIFVNIHYIPIYRQPFYSENFEKTQFPNSEKYYSSAISLPIFPGLKKIELQKIKKIILKPQNYQTLF